MTALPAVPRYAPEVPFPPYAYVPGQGRHPVRDRGGHSFGLSELRFGPVPTGDGSALAFRQALDLLNHGYPWEAHEAFEAWWRPSDGQARAFFQGLLRLAAAEVKRREGRLQGAIRHGLASQRLLAQVAADNVFPGGHVFLGVDLASLVPALEAATTDLQAQVAAGVAGASGRGNSALGVIVVWAPVRSSLSSQP